MRRNAVWGWLRLRLRLKLRVTKQLNYSYPCLQPTSQSSVIREPNMMTMAEDMEAPLSHRPKSEPKPKPKSYCP